MQYTHFMLLNWERPLSHLWIWYLGEKLSWMKNRLYHFHLVLTAQGNSDKCLRITLPGVFTVVLHKRQGEHDWLFCVCDGACSVPDVAQTAVPPKALRRTQTLPRELQTGHGVLATSTNTALFHSARLIQCDRFSMIHLACNNHFYRMDV